MAFGRPYLMVDTRLLLKAPLRLEIVKTSDREDPWRIVPVINCTAPLICRMQMPATIKFNTIAALIDLFAFQLQHSFIKTLTGASGAI